MTPRFAPKSNIQVVEAYVSGMMDETPGELKKVSA
jgi:hypothetical protein